MSILPRILITPGEPAGIGPDITVQIAQNTWPAELVAIADPQLLADRAKQLHLPLRLIECEADKIGAQGITPHEPGTLKILPIRNTSNTNNANYVIRTLELAASLCLKKNAHALVTGPVNKSLLNQAGIHFTGHTDFFAHYCHVAQTVMLFVVDDLKVALATTHLPLAKVPQAITAERLKLTITILREELKQYFHLPEPRILICGLNPHAGEGGYLGREEIDTITPVITDLNKLGYHLTGPLPADTIFTPEHLKKADAILAMYHDQALPVVKYLGFGHAVNMTLGLPFIRTSVDHGTAIDLAGTGKANAGSMQAAIKLAITCAERIA